MKATLTPTSCSGCATRRVLSATGYRLVCLALVIWQTGCATARSSRTSNCHAQYATRPPLANLGTLGVIATSTVPKFTVHEPLNREEAGEFTARQIVFLGGDDFTDDTSMLAAQLTLGLSPFLLSALAVPGRTVAQAMAVSEKRLSDAHVSLSETISKLNLQEELRTRVAQRTAARTTIPVRLVPKPFPTGREAEFSRMSCVMAGTLAWLPRGQTAADYLASLGVDTVLELQLIHPGLKGSGNIHPTLALCADVRARLLEANSGRELWAGTAQYRSAKRKFTTWAADEARPFRRELDCCFNSLADQIAGQIAGRSAEGAGRLGPEFAQH